MLLETKGCEYQGLTTLQPAALWVMQAASMKGHLCCRYIDAPMADVAAPGRGAPVLAPQEPLEERAAAARERHALHQAEGVAWILPHTP